MWVKFGPKSLAVRVGQVRLEREVLGKGSRKEVKALWERTISHWEVGEERVERREGEEGWSRIVHILQQELRARSKRKRDENTGFVEKETRKKRN